MSKSTTPQITEEDLAKAQSAREEYNEECAIDARITAETPPPPTPHWVSKDGIIEIYSRASIGRGYGVSVGGVAVWPPVNLDALETVGVAMIAAAAYYRDLDEKKVPHGQ